jgi:uncharacterized protein (TIGR00255 family)
MTGFGGANCQERGLSVAVEVRAVNSRFFKLSFRASDGYSGLEPQVEELARQTIRRGTVQVNLRVERTRSAQDVCINSEVLSGYRTQLATLAQKWNDTRPIALESLLLLPGVVEDRAAGLIDPTEQWPTIRDTLSTALANLMKMRADEGAAMAADLLLNCRTIAASLNDVLLRAPQVQVAYRSRLEERLRSALAEFQVTVELADIVKEVMLFAERGDISEEIVRLRSHLEQFDSIVALPESSGRKLEFLTQEMFREANTIGSKANDVEIAKAVIEMKTAIERIREMIQNIE